jgi:hypothetical protein
MYNNNNNNNNKFPDIKHVDHHVSKGKASRKEPLKQLINNDNNNIKQI